METRSETILRNLKSIKIPFALIVSASLVITIGQAQGATPDLTELSIEELMNVQVVSPTKQAQRLADTASAIFVITQDDIRRSGVTNIPDALRLAPGVQVARIDASKWAITIRGFNGRFANTITTTCAP
ncbi:MAG: TonB-dependent receptor plug domain-containing protein [Candidatus Competibacteraceae bacterium]